MNALKVAVNNIKFAIPKMILEDVFVNRYRQFRHEPISMEERIMEEVIRKRVLPDCQIEYGIISYIPFTAATQEYIGSQPGDYQTVYTFDKRATGGRGIMSALSVTYNNPYVTGMNVFNPTGNSMVTAATNSLSNAISNVPINSSARVSLINENTVLVRDVRILPQNSHLMCILENDDNLSNIRPKSIPWFKKLIVLAVKAYIYNELVLTLDQGRLYAGQDLGRYREIVDGYADANELYEEMLDEKIGKIFFMNDEENMTAHVKLMLGGPR